MLFLSELVLDFQCLYFEICETVPIRQFSSCKHVCVMYTPLHPTFISSKIVVFRGYIIFLFLL